MDATSTSGLSSLESKIHALSELSNRVENLRQVPSFLLRTSSNSSATLDGPPANSEHGSGSSRLKGGLDQLKKLTGKIRTNEVQEALVAARDSEHKDKSGLELNPRRQDLLKHCRPPSPESPQPFVSFQPSTTLPFPTWDNTVAALNLENLPSFIRDYNSTNKSRLRIWFPTANKPHNGSLNTPVIAQFVIRDVVTIYLTLDYLPKDTTLVVESATAFGPQEKKPPHSQSDYSVYQKLSQQLAKVIQAQPQAPFQLIMRLLASYEDLFVRQCSVCGRVLSPEGYVPPVARVWTPDVWEARHSTCLRK